MMKRCLKRAQITTTPTNEAFILLGLMTCTGHQREKKLSRHQTRFR